MPLDPFSILDRQYARLGMPTLARARPRQSNPYELTPEEEQSLLARTGKATLGGIGKVGSFFDVPGSMVRDTLGGRNPFDQLLTPFSPENRLTGRDLLRQYGMVGNRDTWGNFAGGLGAEIVFDPFSWFPPFALTKAGMIAKQTGKLGKAAEVASAAAGRKVGRLEAGLRTSLGNILEAGRFTDEGLLSPGSVSSIQAAQRAAKGAGVPLSSVLNDPLRNVVGFHIPFVGDVGGFGGKASRIRKPTADVIEDALPTNIAPAAGQAAAESLGDVHDVVRGIPQNTLDEMRAVSSRDDVDDLPIAIYSIFGDHLDANYGGAADRQLEKLSSACRVG
jgi:hypothetical protein